MKSILKITRKPKSRDYPCVLRKRRDILLCPAFFYPTKSRIKTVPQVACMDDMKYDKISVLGGKKS